ncbi:L-aspartate oxidase [Granulicella sp. 5B5]|uniref:L-aspartate oxidase n=1 Tax=Granulicella sp. 5B5 TaxID=1617967 RepID=UPI0015F62D33|nr:L-aspartate oxidase [Granulicella sp. 5B5]QMV18360.1 L-aspartate oxidase [Granulicella sp. 5B5]
MKRVVVVGSGIAGLVAALELSDKCEVTLVTKAALADSNTRWAQGGIAAVMFEDDSVPEHIADTLSAGAGLCDAAAVEVLCSEGPLRIRDLIRLGVAFDTHEGELARGLEAAHGHARVLHAGGDATGLNLEMTLVRAVRAANVLVMEHTFACELVVKDERARGLEILSDDGKRSVLDADAVVLACGGAGQLYRYSTNPVVATGDGVALALRAGVQLADIEFYQFHPTALATRETFLISEAVRGEGAVLLDAKGERFMQKLHPDAELAPRDVVARSIAWQMALQGGKPVLLDAARLEREMGAGFLAKRFPTIDAAVKARGFDWTKEPVPVTPAAHYWMGGVKTDLWGRTSIAGLYAAGEVACTGVHGANRLASNSLLESLVYAWRCAEQLPQDDVRRWPEVRGAVLALAMTEERGAREAQRGELQTLMWNRVGIERSRDGLREAAEQMASWRGCNRRSANAFELETANMLTIARAMVTVALERRESRGAHYRVDYPETRVEMQHSIVCAEKVLVAAYE